MKTYTLFNGLVNTGIDVYGNVNGTVYGINPHKYKASDYL